MAVYDVFPAFLSVGCKTEFWLGLIGLRDRGLTKQRLNGMGNAAIDLLDS